ncbi:hypothetical protein ACFFRR_006957 [Megaselia abdita]
MESKLKKFTKVSEIKDLVKMHIQENKLRRETYLELLQELDKNLDNLNKKLDNITENAIEMEEHFKQESPPETVIDEIIDLSFLPLTNVDDMDDLEQKLSSDYDYKQNMIETVCLFGDIQNDPEEETRKFMEILFTSEVLYDFTYDGLNPNKMLFKEYQHIIDVLFYIVLKNFGNFTIDDTISIVRNYLQEITINKDEFFSE